MRAKQTTSARHVLQTLAALIIIMTGIKLGSTLMILMLLSVLLALFIHPVVNFLARHRIPRTLGIILTLTAFVIFMLFFQGNIGKTTQKFSAALPGDREQLTETFRTAQETLSRRNIHLNLKTVMDSLDPSAMVGLLTDMIGRLGSTMSYALLILLTTIFMLIEAPALCKHRHPLTLCFKILMESSSQWKNVAILLGSKTSEPDKKTVDLSTS